MHLAVAMNPASARASKSRCKSRFLASIFRLVFNMFSAPACRLLALPPGPSDSPGVGSVVLGTLYGYRKGHVHLVIQEDAKSKPFVILELATPTSALVKEMSSGLVRIALECEKHSSISSRCKLMDEAVWSMFCNGRRTGHAVRRPCNAVDSHILELLQSVSMGAAVLPMDDQLKDGELMYMRAKFERVFGSRDSAAFYMMNPEGAGAPELSIFFLRI